MNQNAEGQTGFLQHSLSFGDFGEGAAENVRRAIQIVPQLSLQLGFGRGDLARW